jgi:outer membrane protein assembly factor BamB
MSLPAVLSSWFDFGSPITSSPAIVDGKAYVLATNGLIACLDLASNSVVWKRNIGGTNNDCSPAVGYGKVYVGSTSGHFYVLNAANGNIINDYTTGSMIFAPPLLLSTGVYFGSYDGIFHAISLDGASKWRDTAQLHIVHAAAASNGQIVYADGNTNLVWLEDSGTYAKIVLKTRYSPLSYSSITGFISCPAIWRDTIIIGESEAEMANRIRYLSFSTGTLLKSRSIYAGGAFGGTLRAGASVDTSTGLVFLATSQSGLDAGWVSVPSYGAYPAGYYAVNTPPAVTGNVVIFGTDNNGDSGGCNIHFRNKSNGSVLWSYKPSSYKAISGGPAVSEGRVLVGSMDGCIYGFGSGPVVNAPVVVDTTGGSTGIAANARLAGEWTMTVHPNPVSGGVVQFDFNGNISHHVLSVLDIRGRVVRHLNLQNGGTLSWDMKDGLGKRIAAGHYTGIIRDKRGAQVRSFRLKVLQ